MPYQCLGCHARLRSDDWVVYMSRLTSEDAADSLEIAIGTDAYAHPECHPVAYGRDYRFLDEGILGKFEAKRGAKRLSTC